MQQNESFFKSAELYKPLIDSLSELKESQEPQIFEYLQAFYKEFSSQLWQSSLFKDPICETFTENVLIPLAKALLSLRALKSAELYKLISQILQEFVRIGLMGAEEDCLKALELTKLVLDPNKILYKCMEQEENSLFCLELLNAAQPALASFQKGQLIDAVKIDSVSKKVCWSQGEIIEVDETFIKVAYLYDFPTTSRSFEKTSRQIAPINSKTFDFPWRLSLKVLDLVDCLDNSNNWYQSTIIDRRIITSEEKEVIQVCVGFRIFDDHGDQYEYPSNKRYYGWASRYDEWLPITSPRIQPLKTIVRGNQPRYKSMDCENLFDDCNDLLYKPLYSANNPLFAVTRTYNRSLFLMRLVNSLGKMGTFQGFVEKLSEKNKYCGIDMTILLVEIVNNLNPMLYRDFAESFIGKFKDAVFENILRSPNSNLRNFTKEKIDGLIKNMQELLKRAFCPSDQLEMIEKFSLDLSFLCFNSEFLERKLQGLKTIMEIIKEVKYRFKRYDNLLDSDQLCRWLKEKAILEGLYGANSHSQLIQRSSDFLKFMVNEDFLKKEDFLLIWKNLRTGNKEEKLCIYKLLSSVSVYFKTDHIEFLVQRLHELPIEEFCKEDLELLYEITRYQVNNKSIELYWKIVKGAHLVNSEVLELVQVKVVDVLKGWDMENKRTLFLKSLVENLENHFAVVVSLKLMRKIIEAYSYSANNFEETTRVSICELLITEKQLLSVLGKSLQTFKEKIQQNSHDFSMDSEGNPEEIFNKLSMTREIYLQEVLERVSFYGFLCNLTPTAFSFEEIRKFWAYCVKSGLLDSEKNAVYRLVKEIFDQKQYDYLINQEDLPGFFTKELCNDLHWLESLSIEGFLLYKQLFLKINESKQLLTKYTKPKRIRAEGFWGNHYGGGISNDIDENSQQDCYIRKIAASNLIGYDSLFLLSINLPNNSARKDAVSLLLDLELNRFDSTQTFEEKLASRRAFLQRLLAVLQENSTDNQISNCLNVIETLFKETEKQGIGDLKPHEAIIVGEPLTLSINNEILQSSVRDSPQTFEISTFSNTLLYDLRRLIAERLKTSPELLSLSRKAEEIRDEFNGFSLRSLGFCNETLTIKRRYLAEIPQAPLLTEKNELSPRLTAILKELFARFSSKDGLMSKKQCAQFRSACVNDECDPTDRRITEIFRTYDDDRDDFLTESNFLEFYLAACKSNAGAVYRNIETFGFRTDFKRVEELNSEEIDNFRLLPRNLLAMDQMWYQSLFRLLGKNGEIADLALKILMKLPTCPKLLAEIQGENHEKQGVSQWETVLSGDCPHKLLYRLQIVEFLSMNYQWKQRFALNGGVEYLYEVFLKLAKPAKTQENQQIYGKIVLSKLFQLLQNLIFASFYREMPKENARLLEKMAQMLRSSAALEQVAQNLLQLCPLQSEIAGKTQETQEFREIRTERKKSLEVLENNKEKSLLSLYDCEKKQEFIEKPVEIVQEMKEEGEKVKEITRNFENIENFEENPEISQELARKILEIVDLKQLVLVLAEFVAEILENPRDFDGEDRYIIENSLSFFLGVASHSRDFLEDFLLHSEKTLIAGLFSQISSFVRKICANFVYLSLYSQILLEKSRGVRILQGFVHHLLEYLPEIANKECEQYHELLCHLIELLLVIMGNEGGLEAKIVDYIVNGLRNHQSIETPNGKKTDRVLIGLIKMCGKVMKMAPFSQENFALGLFSLLLFDEGGEKLQVQRSNGKCKSEESRKAAFALILEVCKAEPMNIHSVFMKGLAPLLSKVSGAPDNNNNNNNNNNNSNGNNNNSGNSNNNNNNNNNNNSNNNSNINSNISRHARSSYGYVGIKNLGCICYMNAMLQQFFMNPGFRYALLMANDKKPANLQSYKGNYYDDNVLHQLQEMFAFLEVSDRMDYNPQGFCFAFKDFQGNPVNVSIQQDAQEFVNMIFDKLENGLKSGPFNNLLDNIYGGRCCTQLICEECGNKKEREELFYSLSLEVKNMKNVYESLEKYIAGEVISDYLCEKCNKKAQTTKRSCLSRCPNVLIIHLQRIVFDLDSLQNEKISTRLEFPFDLDLFQYSYEKIEGSAKSVSPEQYKYKLTGVIVHTGTAQYGHYYSYINIKRDLEAKDPTAKYEDKWLQFDDSHVRDFDLKNFEEECFGGSADFYRDDWGWGGSSRNTETSKSAYMLVYEREYKTPLFVGMEGLDITMRNFLVDAGGEEKEGVLQVRKAKPYVPQELYEKIARDNAGFMTERHVFNENFLKFVQDLLLCVKLPELTPAIYSKGYEDSYGLEEENYVKNQGLHQGIIETLFALIYEILPKINENSCIVEFSSLLKHLLYLNPKFISENFESLVLRRKHKDFVLFEQDRTVRTYCSSILLHVINIVIAYNHLTLEKNQDSSLNILDSQIQKFLGEFFALIKTEAQKNMAKPQQFFEFWRDFAYSGPTQKNYLLRTHTISVLLSFLLTKDKDSSSSYSNIYKHPVSTYDPLLQAISYLISQTPKEALSQYNSDLSSLFSSEFYEKALREGLDMQCLSSIIEKFAHENESFSLMMIMVILKGMNKVMFDEVRIYSELFTSLLNIKDSLQKKRMQWLLGYPQPEIICTSNNMDNYGIYGLNNLDDKTIGFPSLLNIDNSMSILDLMVYNINRVESVCLVCLKQLLLLSTLHADIFEYLVNLPSHCYIYAKFIDWFKPFLDKYQQDLNRCYFGDSRKKEICEEAIRLLDIFLKKFQEKYPENPTKIPNNSIEIETTEPILTTINNDSIYLIGQTMNETLKELEKTDEYSFSYKEVSALTLRSQPTGKGNLALPRTIAKDTYLFPSSVDSSSVYSCFVHSKYTYNESYNRKGSKLNHLYQFFKAKIWNTLTISKGVDEEAPLLHEKPEENKENKEDIGPPPLIEKEKMKEDNNNCKDPLSDLSEEFRVYDCIRKYTFQNHTNKPLLVSLSLKIANNGPLLNIYPLHEEVLVLVKSYTLVEIFTLMKRNLEKDWDNYEITLKKYTIFSGDSFLKETNVFMKYIEQRNMDIECLLIEDENANQQGKHDYGQIVTTSIMRENQKGNIRSRVTGKTNSGVNLKDLETFPEDPEFIEGYDRNGNWEMKLE